MGGGTACDTLDFASRINQLAQVLFAVVKRLKFRYFLHGGVDGDTGPARNELRNSIGFREWHAQGAANVSHRSFGRQRSEGHNLGDSVITVLPDHVIDNF